MTTARSRTGYFFAVALLLLVVYGVAAVVAWDRRQEPARARGALVAFLRALEAGDVNAAEMRVHSNTRDPAERPALMAYLERQAGAAQLNVAVAERFGEPMPGTDWPLSGRVDQLPMSASGTTYSYLFDGLTGTLVRPERTWLVDLFGIGSVPLDIAVAKAERSKLEALAARVRAGEFESPAEVRRAVEPIPIRAAGWSPANEP